MSNASVQIVDEEELRKRLLRCNLTTIGNAYQLATTLYQHICDNLADVKTQPADVVVRLKRAVNTFADRDVRPAYREATRSELLDKQLATLASAIVGADDPNGLRAIKALLR